jgi:cell division inhibitor SepF
MEEFEMTESPGIFARIANIWKRNDAFEEVEDTFEEEIDRPFPSGTRSSSRMDVVRIHETRYTVTVRRDVVAFQDALAAAKAFKAGDQQILNLTRTEQGLRKTIEDFLSGVAFGLEGSFDAVAPQVYMLAPRAAKVDLAPAAEPASTLYGDVPNWGETGT